MSRTHRNIWQHEKPSTASKASYVATICTSILGLPALVSGFLFISMRGMHMSCIILCYFGDKRCEMVAHIQKNQLLCNDCRFRATPSAWKLRIARYRYVQFCYEAHLPKKGVSYDDEYVPKDWFTIRRIALRCDAMRRDATRCGTARRL